MSRVHQVRPSFGPLPELLETRNLKLEIFYPPSTNHYPLALSHSSVTPVLAASHPYAYTASWKDEGGLSTVQSVAGHFPRPRQIASLDLCWVMCNVGHL
jgi:hypothetical protein